MGLTIEQRTEIAIAIREHKVVLFGAFDQTNQPITNQVRIIFNTNGPKNDTHLLIKDESLSIF